MDKTISKKIHLLGMIDIFAVILIRG